MKRLNQSSLLLALCAAFLSPSALADCGLDLNPATLDTNKDAQLSRAEVSGSPLEPVFGRIDTNGDGLISQTEYASRCRSLQATQNSGWDTSGWEDTAAGKRAERQKNRQQNRVDNRVNRETDKATDSAVDKVMGAIFGR